MYVVMSVERKPALFSIYTCLIACMYLFKRTNVWFYVCGRKRVYVWSHVSRRVHVEER